MIEVEESEKTLIAVNQAQIEELKRAGAELDPVADCTTFRQRALNMQAAIVHTYQITAWKALREEDPGAAARLWKDFESFCDSTLSVLKTLRGVYAQCGSPELYDLVLDYKIQAQRRFIANQEDSECQTMPPGLFPKTI